MPRIIAASSFLLIVPSKPGEIELRHGVSTWTDMMGSAWKINESRKISLEAVSFTKFSCDDNSNNATEISPFFNSPGVSNDRLSLFHSLWSGSCGWCCLWSTSWWWIVWWKQEQRRCRGQGNRGSRSVSFFLRFPQLVCTVSLNIIFFLLVCSLLYIILLVPEQRRVPLATTCPNTLP